MSNNSVAGKGPAEISKTRAYGSFPGFALILFCLVALFSKQSPAQQITADLVGRIADSSGAALPGASVTAVNLGTGYKQNTVSGSSGDYTLTLLPPGSYSIRVEAAHFKQYGVPSLTLVAGDRLRVDAVMEVGEVSQKVEVTSVGPALETDSSDVSTAVAGEAVQNLPLNGRNYVQLALLAPSISPGPGNGLSTGNRPDDRRQDSQYSVDGQDPTTNNNVLDGMDNNERIIGTIGIRPSIDAISEFTIQTSNYSAEVGRTSGGVVTILTKSGTNQLHGSLFEFLRNDALDANSNYNFSGGSPLPKQEYRQNQFGGSVGGPIRKDKTFFFGDYEGLRIVQGLPFNVAVPSAKQRTGDLSESCTAGFSSSGICGKPAQQLNIANAVDGLPKGPVPFNQLNRAPYSAYLDPIGLKMAALFPLPTAQSGYIGSSIGSGNSTNYSANRRYTYFGTTADGRIDHYFTGATSFFGRYSYNNVTVDQPGPFPTVDGINPGGAVNFPGTSKERTQNIALSLVHVFTPKLLGDFKAGYLRAAITTLPLNQGVSAANTLGFPCTATSCINTGDPQTFGLPYVVVQGFQNLGDSPYEPLTYIDNAYQYAGSLTYQLGAHDMKIGLALVRRQFSGIQSKTARGAFTFNASSSSAPAPTNAGIANFLLGEPVSIGRVASLYEPQYRTWEPSGYFQDNWHVKPWLTLNMGLRYDLYTPKVEVRNRMSNIDPTTGVVLVSGLNSGRTAGIGTDYSNVGPRVGFAATLRHGTVLRGAFGISYFPGDYTSTALLKNQPFTSVFACGSSVTVSLTNTGCPAGIGLLSQGVPLPSSAFPTTSSPSGPTVDLTKLPRGGFIGEARNYPASRVKQYNLTIEKQLGENLLSAGYVGHLGSDLVLDLSDLDRALPSGTPTPNPRPLVNLPSTVTNLEYEVPWGTSNYNALELSFKRRYNRGLSVLSSFTWARGIDDASSITASTGGAGLLIGPLPEAQQNIASYDRGVSDFNVRLRWTLGATYEIPFGKSLTGVSGVLLKGWQVNTIDTWQTGLPFAAINLTNVSGITGLTPGILPGVGNERPDRLLHNLVLPNHTVGTHGQYLNPKAFAIQAPYTLGNSPRNVGVGPNIALINLSVFKEFAVKEDVKLQFRVESFNLPNHPNFGNPSATVGSASFGQITSLASLTTMRQMQFALKLLF